METADNFYLEGKKSLESKRFTKAIECYDKSISLKPDYPEAYHGKGLCLYEFLKREDAIKCFDKAIQLNPSFADAYLAKGVCLRDLGKNEDALTCFNKSIQHKNLNPKAHFTKGALLRDLHRLEESNEALSTALVQQADNHLAYHNKALNFRELGKREEAIQALDAAIKIKSDVADYYLLKARLLYYLGKVNDAVENFKKVLELNPNSSPALQGLACAYRDQGKFEDALGMINKAIKNKPEFHFAFVTKAYILRDQGKLKEAMEAITIAVKVCPGDLLYLLLRIQLGTESKDETHKAEDEKRIQELLKENNFHQAALKASVVGVPDDDKRELAHKLNNLYSLCAEFGKELHDLDKEKPEVKTALKSLEEFRKSTEKFLEKTLFHINFSAYHKDISELLKIATEEYSTARQLETTVKQLNPNYKGGHISEQDQFTLLVERIKSDPVLDDYNSVAFWVLNSYTTLFQNNQTPHPLIVKLDSIIEGLIRLPRQNRTETIEKLLTQGRKADAVAQYVSRISAVITKARSVALLKTHFEHKALTHIQSEMSKEYAEKKDSISKSKDPSKEKKYLSEVAGVIAFILRSNNQLQPEKFEEQVQGLLKDEDFENFLNSLKIEDKDKKDGNKKKACCTIF